MKKEGIELEGFYGTWHVIDSKVIWGKKVFLLESEQDGEDVPGIIVDSSCNIMLDEAYNGFSDLEDM